MRVNAGPRFGARARAMRRRLRRAPRHRAAGHAVAQRLWASWLSAATAHMSPARRRLDQDRHWRRERLQALVWPPAHRTSGRDGLRSARADEHGQLTTAGVVQLGFAGNRRVALQQLAGVARADRRLPLAGVLVDVDHHGPRGGQLRDAVLREVHAAA